MLSHRHFAGFVFLEGAGVESFPGTLFHNQNELTPAVCKLSPLEELCHTKHAEYITQAETTSSFFR